LLKSNGIKIEEDEEETHVIEPLTHGGREGVTTQAVWNERATIGLSIPRGSGPGTLFIHKEEAHYVEKYVTFASPLQHLIHVCLKSHPIG
jgi:hypothetical protein